MTWLKLNNYQLQHVETGAIISRARCWNRWRYTLWPSPDRSTPFDSVHDSADAAQARHVELLEAAE